MAERATTLLHELQSRDKKPVCNWHMTTKWPMPITGARQIALEQFAIFICFSYGTT